MGHIWGRLGAMPCCFCCPDGYELVEGEERAIQFDFGNPERNGRDIVLKQPDLYFVNPYTSSLRKVDIQLQVVRGSRQTLPTTNSSWITFEPVISFQVPDQNDSIYRVISKTGNVRQMVEAHVLANLRSFLSTKTDVEAARFNSDDFVNGNNLGEYGVELKSVNLDMFTINRQS